MSIYAVARDLQSRFGSLLDLKADTQRKLRDWRKKPFEPEFEILQHLDFAGRCAIDVGANRGQSLQAIRLFQPTCTIHAFEPNQILADRLIARYQSDEEVNLHKVGLGNAPAELDLYVPYYRKFMYDGLASFDEAEASDWLNKDTVWRFDEKLLRVEKLRCPISTLDDQRLSPAFMKVDVQGFEKAVFEGGRKTVQTHKPLILMETNTEATEDLKVHGWRPASYEGGQLLLDQVGGTNTFFLHELSAEHQALIKTCSGKT